MYQLPSAQFTVLTCFQLVIAFVILSLVCLCSYIAYIANNMDPDRTAPKVV